MPIFSIKICCHYLRRTILTTSTILKCFKDKHELNSVIPNNGICGINSCKNERLWWGPNICDFLMIDWLISWFNCHAWSILFCSMTCSKLFLNCALTSLLDSALWFVTQVRIYSHSGISICMFWFSYVHDSSGYSLFYSSIAMIASFY